MQLPKFNDLCSERSQKLLAEFREGTHHLSELARDVDTPWDSAIPDAVKLHNNYVMNLLACYSGKVADLSESLLISLERFDYFTYALCGRALIETVATLRYYIVHRYKPLIDKGTLTADDLRTLIEVDDKHLRGTRFDWGSFILRKYSRMKEDAVKQLSKKKEKNSISGGDVKQQVNVLTCIEKWAAETPFVLIAYDLFCDLVHPNIGSNFLVASVKNGEIYFSKYKGDMLGHHIFEESFPVLVSLTHKVIGGLLVELTERVALTSPFGEG